jgi:hypothetical protein
MIPSCVSSCTEPRSVRRQLPISLPQGPSRPPMPPILRHGDRKRVAVTLLDSAFTKRHTRNSFRMSIYENCRGVPSFFLAQSRREGLFRNSPLITLSAQASRHSPLFPVSCRLLVLSSGEGLTRVSSLECAVPRFRGLSALECALTETGSRNSFRMRSYEKRWGEGDQAFPKAFLEVTIRRGMVILREHSESKDLSIPLETLSCELSAVGFFSCPQRQT